MIGSQAAVSHHADTQGPALGQHLSQFKTALSERLTDGWHSKGDTRWVRPWWTLHNDRRTEIGTPEHDWASFCVTARWGGGGQLVVGLAPPGAVPKSSLHLLFADTDANDRYAAYLCGIYNSSLFQQLAETMPPGQTRGGELEALGLPRVDDDIREDIEKHVYTLAGLVRDVMSTSGLGDVYPALRGIMREDVTLSDTPEAWTPTPGSSLTWGTVGSVSWMETAGKQGPQAKRITGATLEHTLFGHVLRLVHDSPTANAYLELSLHDDHQPDPDEQETLLTWAAGLGLIGVHLREVKDQPLSVSLRSMHTQRIRDTEALAGFVDTYRNERASIEAALTG